MQHDNLKGLARRAIDVVSEPWDPARSRALDRAALERLGLPGVVLMENAGRAAAAHVAETVDGRSGAVVALAGAGNNGGDAWVVARWLHLVGIPVEVLALRAPDDLGGDAGAMARAYDRLGLPWRRPADAAAWRAAAHASLGAAALVDGLLGTGGAGPPREPLRTALEAFDGLRQEGGPPVVALDVPSGLDAAGGGATGPVLRADLTVTFVAPKVGLTTPAGTAAAGRVVVVGIGVPALLAP